MTYALNDLVRVVSGSSKYAGQEGRVSSVDYTRSVPLVVDLPGSIMGICFNDENVELVEAAAALPHEAEVELELFEVYAEDGTLRWVTSNRNELGNRRATDYVLTRVWKTNSRTSVYSRPIG